MNSVTETFVKLPYDPGAHLDIVLENSAWSIPSPGDVRLDTFALTNATVLSGQLFVTTEDGKLVHESLRREWRDLKRNGSEPDVSAWLDEAKATPHKGRLAGTWVIGSASVGNYFHWMMESLASYMWAAEHVRGPLGIIVPMRKAQAKFVDETMNWPGLKVHKLHHEQIGVERLIMPGIARKRIGQYSTDVDRQMDKLSDMHAGPSPVGARLYLSRARQSRSLVNEADLAMALEAHGFTSIDPAAYSVADQIRIFRNAGTIIAPHGAAQTNIAFCKAGCRVIELRPQARAGNACFAAIARIRGLDYSAMDCANDAADIPAIIKLVAN